MGQKKKIRNKENQKPIKKSTIHHFNYTQQIQIPTNNTLQNKNINKSIELKKITCIKKSLSRKSKCISVKQTSNSVKPTCTSVKQTNAQPIKFKQLMRRFQQLKGLQQRCQKSRSKSAKSIRQGLRQKSPSSGIKYKLNNKKSNLHQFLNKTLTKKSQNNKSDFNSRMSLTNKLQKTLKRLNQNNYFQNDQQDSLFPFVSTSEAEQYAKNKSIQISGNQIMQDDQINIFQMRRFSKTLQSEQFYENGFKRHINYFKGDQYQFMAIKIQRAWRRYRTKKLVDRYAVIFRNNYQQDLQYVQGQQFINRQIDLSKHKQVKSFEQDNIDHQESISNESFIQRDDHQSNQQQGDEENDSLKSQDIDFQQQQYKSQQEKQSMQSSNNQNSASGLLETQKLYPENLLKQQHLITYISNLQDQQNIQNSINQQNRQQQMQKNQIQAYRHSQDNQNSYQQNNYQVQKKSKNKQIQKYEEMISQIRKVELQKWQQVIQLLEQNKHQKNPAEVQDLLQKLQRKTERNKKSMQQIKNECLISSNKRNAKQQIQIPLKDQKLKQRRQRSKIKKQKTDNNESDQQKCKRKKQQSGPSQSSDFKRDQQFDSRKYIEYLDSDMFLLDRQKSSENSELINDQRLGKRISKRKQRQLLAGLNIQGPPIKLRSHHVSKSQNLYIQLQSASFIPAISHRLNKSTSQKNIIKVIKSLSPQLQYPDEQNQNYDQLNLDIIRQEFLQNADPIEQLQKFHTNNELKMKIKQSLQSDYANMMNTDSEEDEPRVPCRISLDLDKTFDIHEKQKNQKSKTLSQQNIFPREQPNKKDNQKIIVIQNIDKNLQEQLERNQDEQERQKLENLSFMVYNTLILQVLREIASYDVILEKFKQYTLAVKAQHKQGKRGFQTNHTEVKLYVESLVSFLLNQEPQVFKNLQIPAGPSALEMLHYMHPNQYDQSIQQESNNSQDQTSVMVIPNRMFDKFWQVKEKTIKFQAQSEMNVNNQRKRKNLDYLKSLTKVFYRSIFDTYNECLDLQRNFGQAGKPYPWKRPSRFQHTKTLMQIQKSIQSSQKRMNQIATTYCGLIIQKNEMARITMQGSDDYIQHVQQDRMSRMLAQDLIEGEQRWTFYDDQELQLLVQIGNYITISLVLEAGEDIKNLIG